MPSANDLAILSQHSQTYHLRLDLLDTDFIKIGEVSGIATALTYSMSADSDIRANASLTMHVGDPSYLADSFSNVWLNRLVRLNYGLEDTAGNIAWYLWGSMLMNENSYTYDEKTQELSLTLVDMMAALTEIRGRQIGGYGILIPEGNNARNAIISTVAMFSPFKRYNVPELPDTIPYDLEFSATSYPYTVIKGILSLFPTYEMFYSKDGVFTVREIPTGIGDEVFVDETVLDPLIISERKTSRFSDVRNTTELMGMSLESDYTAMSCTTTGNRYDIFIMNTFEVLEDGMRYGFTPDTTSVVGQTLKIQNTAEIAIYQQTGAGAETPIAAGAMQAGIPYCIKYTAGKFYLQGELDIHVIVQEVQTALTPEEQQTFKDANDCRNVQWIVNPTSPFAADVIGDIRQVLQDGEYSEITTTNLAFERAKYENWQKTRLQDSVELATVLIPWMSVNVKIQYTSPLTGQLSQYLVQAANIDISGFTMTMSLIKFYPVYPW